MKFLMLSIALILIGITTQNLGSWDANWSSDTFSSSGDQNLSLDSLLGGGQANTASSDNWSSSSDSMNWSSSDSSSGNAGWSSISGSADNQGSSDWTTTSTTPSATALDWSNTTTSTNDYQTTTQDQTTTTNTYATSQVYYDKPQITQVQHLVSKPMITKKIISQPLITKKIVQQPIIKQRIVQTPIIRKKVVSRPVYTETQNMAPIVDSRTSVRTVPISVPGKTTVRETYYQPTVLTKDVQLQLNRGQTQVNDMPVQTRPTRYSEEVVNKVVRAPAKEIYTQPIYQKQVINNSERVNFVKSQPVYRSNAPIVREPVLQERTRYETITRPGREIYNNTYIQPIVQRENVNLQFNRQPDRNVHLDPVVAPVRYNTRTRTQTVNVPGNQIITQPIYQRMIHRNDVHHVQQPVVRRVAVHRPYPVPTPVIKKVPIIRRIPVPVLKRRSRGMKIINLNKVTINGGDSYSSDSESWDHGYDDQEDEYNGWVDTTDSHKDYDGSLQEAKVARMSPFSYRKSSVGYGGAGSSYGRYSRNGGADVMYGRTFGGSRYSRGRGYGQQSGSWGHGYGHSHGYGHGHSHGSNWGSNYSQWGYSPYGNYY